jgi:hypothetical protein
MINDIYIKFIKLDPPDNNCILSENIEDADKKVRLINSYKENILGEKSYIKSWTNTKTKIEKQPTTENLIQVSQANQVSEEGKDFIILPEGDIAYLERAPPTPNTLDQDLIITFNLTFNSTNNSTGEASTLLPKSSVLAVSVFNTIYNSFVRFHENFLQLEEIKAGTGVEFIKTYTYEDDLPEKLKGAPEIFNFDEDENPDKDFLKPYLQKIIFKDSQLDGNNFLLKTNKEFEDIKFHNLDFYNYLLLLNIIKQEDDARELHATQALVDELNYANDKFNKAKAYAITYNEVEAKLKANPENHEQLLKELNDIAATSDVRELSHSDDLEKHEDVTKALEAANEKLATLNAAAAAKAESVADAQPSKLYENYAKIFSNKSNDKQITQIDIQDINVKKGNQNFLSQLEQELNEKNYITITLDKKINSIGSDPNSNTETLLYDTKNKQYIITFKEFKSFIVNIEIYKSVIQMSDATPEKYLVIDKTFFEIIFKDIFYIKKPYFDEYNLNDVNFCLDIEQRYIQLYINDVTNYYNFCKNIRKPATQAAQSAAPAPEDKAFQSYLSVLEIQNNIVNISNLICLRLYDNFKYVNNSTETYILGQTSNITPDDFNIYDSLKEARDFTAKTATAKAKTAEAAIKKVVTASASTASPSASGASGGKKGGSTKSLKRKYKYKKNISNKKYGGVKTTNRPDNVKDLSNTDSEYLNFIRFTINNETKNVIDNSSVADKTMYIHTKFSLDDVKLIRRENIISSAYNLGFSFFSSIANFFSSTTNTNQAKHSELLKYFEEMKTKKQLLPTLFKKIVYIGFLTDETKMSSRLKQDNNQGTGTGTGQATGDKFVNFFTKSTIADSKIKTINIDWVEIKVEKAMLLDLFALLRGKSEHDMYNLWTGLFSVVLPPFTYYLCSVAIGTGIGIASAALLLYNIWEFANRESVTTEDQINDALKYYIFDLLTQIRYINVDTLEINPSFLFVKSLQDSLKSSSIFVRTSKISSYEGKLSAPQNGKVDVKNEDFASLVKIYYNLLKQPKMETGPPGWWALEKLKSLAKKKTDPDEDKVLTQDDILTKFEAFNNAFKQESKELKRYQPTITNIPGIKNKLKNLNIPLQSFYYAMSKVKSTYNPTNGKMLKDYNKDKAKFMETYKDKLDKK